MAASPITIITTIDSADAEARLVSAVKKRLHADVEVESITSYYWWEGKVQHEPERRIAVHTDKAFDEALEVVSSAHNYDVPMIIAEADPALPPPPHWKGVLHPATEALAASLAGTRLVACAQLDQHGGLAVKTVDKAKAGVEAAVAAAGDGSAKVEWTPIRGNAAYLEWLEKESKPPAH